VANGSQIFFISSPATPCSGHLLVIPMVSLLENERFKLNFAVNIILQFIVKTGHIFPQAQTEILAF